MDSAHTITIREVNDTILPERGGTVENFSKFAQRWQETQIEDIDPAADSLEEFELLLRELIRYSVTQRKTVHQPTADNPGHQVQLSPNTDLLLAWMLRCARRFGDKDLASVLRVVVRTVEAEKIDLDNASPTDFAVVIIGMVTSYAAGIRSDPEQWAVVAREYPAYRAWLRKAYPMSFFVCAMNAIAQPGTPPEALTEPDWANLRGGLYPLGDSAAMYIDQTYRRKWITAARPLAKLRKV